MDDLLRVVDAQAAGHEGGEQGVAKRATTTFSTSSSRGTPTSSTGGADLLSFGASGVTALAVITRDDEVLRPWVVAATPVVLGNSSPWKDLAWT